MFRYDRLNLLVEETGVTKAYLCRKTGHSTYYLRDCEKSESKINENEIRIFANILRTTPEYLTGESDEREDPNASRGGLGDRAYHVGQLYELANDHLKKIVDVTLSVSEKEEAVPSQKKEKTAVRVPKSKRRSDGFVELEVFEDQLPAAGYGTYFDAPRSHMEQYPAELVPNGTTFCVPIGGDSMEPKYKNHATAFVKSAPRVESGEVGLFSLNGEPYIKQLVVDNQKREVRLHSFNQKYQDILITEFDDLRAFGKVLGSYFF